MIATTKHNNSNEGKKKKKHTYKTAILDPFQLRGLSQAAQFVGGKTKINCKSDNILVSCDQNYLTSAGSMCIQHNSKITFNYVQ